MTQQDLEQIQALVTSASNVLVLTHKDPSVDTMASALAIYLALSKMGKNVTVAMESQPLVEVANLVGIDQVKTSLTGGQNLLITYKPYTIGDFEKINYFDDPGVAGGQPGGDSFKLNITVRPGYTPDPKNFSFSFTGARADLIITVEILEPTQVGSLYDANLFSATPIINIDNHDPNKDYGKFNLVEPDAASLSEIVTFFLRAINANIDADIANNLYLGIADATRNFQSEKVAAATFEAAAICLRAGAKPAGGHRASTINPSQPPVNTPAPAAPGAPANNNGNVPSEWTQPKAYRGTSVV